MHANLLKQSYGYICGLLLVITTLSCYAEVKGVSFASAKIRIHQIELEVEYAATYEQRAQGLMHRKSLCDNCGMLFRFDDDYMASMWMKNTYIPLDVAFITSSGRITDILPLYPHDRQATGASAPVRYALEMNQGWFAQHKIAVGDQVIIEP